MRHGTTTSRLGWAGRRLLFGNCKMDQRQYCTSVKDEFSFRDVSRPLIGSAKGKKWIYKKKKKKKKRPTWVLVLCRKEKRQPKLGSKCLYTILTLKACSIAGNGLTSASLASEPVVDDIPHQGHGRCDIRVSQLTFLSVPRHPYIDQHKGRMNSWMNCAPTAPHPGFD
ncbi:hypothetical protein E2C01_018646 [Portunus trituberculatus]|uniref:Uncharacterized protein n=1 Tax=Portunus trituberculatus TaxID=210409 RepID=A0A5B7DWS0_PORTR|nr:hypothetical protein [Portunus trituberculatus]